MRVMSRTTRETMFCHDPSCRRFNEAQEYRWSDATWDSPAEWIDEPACRACGATCREHEYDPDDAEVVS